MENEYRVPVCPQDVGKIIQVKNIENDTWRESEFLIEKDGLFYCYSNKATLVPRKAGTLDGCSPYIYARIKDN